MGATYEAICRDCSHAFEASDGGGFHFFDLHCTVCGQTKSISHDVIPEATAQWFRTIHEAEDTAGVSLAKTVEPDVTADERQHRLTELLDEAANRFNDAIEPIVGKCPCGGRFALYAPVRCPSCRSTNIQEGRRLTTYI